MYLDNKKSNGRDPLGGPQMFVTRLTAAFDNQAVLFTQSLSTDYMPRIRTPVVVTRSCQMASRSLCSFQFQMTKTSCSFFFFSSSRAGSASVLFPIISLHPSPFTKEASQSNLASESEPCLALHNSYSNHNKVIPRRCRQNSANIQCKDLP